MKNKIEKLYQKYRREMDIHLGRDILTYEQFEAEFGSRLTMMPKVAICTGSDQGILHYDVWEERGIQICDIPVFGCYASSERVLVKLFTQVSELLVHQKSTRFQVHVYAHDLQTQRAFSMMQFGYMAETGIRKTAVSCPPCSINCAIRTLGKEEILREWDRIWCMTSSIVAHLQQAPVFYPGSEFREEVYRAFFLSEGTHLHIAFDPNGNMIGMIETNAEPNPLIPRDIRSVNTGEIYVPAEYRGTGLSDVLFAYALEKESDAGYVWVEHGTANPNARGFWGKYFETCTYELDRLIEQF